MEEDFSIFSFPRGWEQRNTKHYFFFYRWKIFWFWRENFWNLFDISIQETKDEKKKKKKRLLLTFIVDRIILNEVETIYFFPENT